MIAWKTIGLLDAMRGMVVIREADSNKPRNPLEVVRFYIATAITLGAPAYNNGDKRGCFEIYSATARLLLAIVQGADIARMGLREALEKSSTLMDVDEQAWIMRQAFDVILESDFPEDDE